MVEPPLSDRPFAGVRAVVRGAGELASGVAFRLNRAGFQVVMTELERPTCISHTACFASAILQGRKQLDGVTGARAASPAQAISIAQAGDIAVLADPAGTIVRQCRPAVVVDGIMAKRNLGTRLTDAPLVIGLGPGFIAGTDVHAVIETKRGHRLGWVITQGSAESNTGVPELIDGQSISRILTAPCSGALQLRRTIGDHVRSGEPVALVSGRPVVAAISGTVRGLLPEGYWVEAGTTVGEIDPSAEREYCYSLSDRALAVGSGALAAILELWPTLPARDELPARVRGRRPRAQTGEEILGAPEFALLGLLADHPAHGYELFRAFGVRGDLQAVCKLGLSQLYADLAKLEALGLVEAVSEAAPPTTSPLPGAGRSAKKIYALTSFGQRQFDQWLQRPAPGTAALRVEFLVKLYFARRRGPQATAALIQQQRHVLAEEIRQHQAASAQPGFRGDAGRAYEAFARGGLAWLDQLQN